MHEIASTTPSMHSLLRQCEAEPCILAQIGLQGGWSCEHVATERPYCVTEDKSHGVLERGEFSLAKVGVGCRSRGVEFGGS